ncbi:glutaminase A [Pseudokineococcus lusitanus]|uniref:glutaminase A n=1 Tax=Pseudokineococcus lusitanus TaxID=763993 RepID=UPI001319C8B4|nr:glutaminase A [Pseudokineococcus lusitanus]
MPPAASPPVPPPARSDRPPLVTARLQDALEACRGHRTGEVADDVPQLADADPELFGVALATLDGHVHEVGDSRRPFTVQSLSKPFAYALALADRGADEVAAHVGVEPSGEAYDAISLEAGTDRPRNPMINAGALATTSLVRAGDAAERSERLRDLLSRLAGHELVVDEEAAAAELASGRRNRALAHLLSAHGMLGVDDPEEAVAAYARQCAVLVDARDLAVVGATLAAGGVHPSTGERVLEVDVVRQVLAVMLTCGMYDAAGDWAATVGMPAKSGICGGLLAVAPAEVGLAAWSPRLDPHGRSVRGLEAVRRLSGGLDLHALHVRRAARAPLRTSTDVARRPSLRPRPVEDARLLTRVGPRAPVHVLHGDVGVAAAERAVRLVERAGEDLDVVVLDLRAVDELLPAAARLLDDLAAVLAEDGRRVLVVDPEGLLAAALDGREPAAAVHGDREGAVVAAEEELLRRHAAREDGTSAAPGPGDHPLLTALDDAAAVVAAGTAVTAADGEAVALDPAALHLVLAGTVRPAGPPAPGAPASFGAGTCAGGPGLPLPPVDDGGVPATADGDVRLLVLDAAALDDLGRDHPRTAAGLWRALADGATARAARLAREVAAADAA